MSTDKIKSGTMMTDEELKNLSGGVIFNATGIIGSDPYNPWELIDNYNGNVLARFRTKEDAIRFSHEKYGYGNAEDTWEVNWDQVCALRKYSQQQ
jgi:hypothetical protein